MNTPRFYKLLYFLFVVMFSACVPGTEKNQDVSNYNSLEVFLVRHGEKVDQSRDPELSPAGYLRAATLAHALQDVDIEFVHSTDFIRTRKTAEPLAAIKGLETELYDQSDLKSLVEEMRREGGLHLVVGHSNTTPRMVELLGGDPGTEIDEYDEYDRLYLVSVHPKGEARTVLLRYGLAYIPDF